MALTLSMLKQATASLYRGAGEPVIYQPAQGQPMNIYAIVDRQSQEVATTIDLKYDDTGNTARIRKSDVLRPVRGDRLIDADGTTYQVENVDDNYNEAESMADIRPID